MIDLPCRRVTIQNCVYHTGNGVTVTVGVSNNPQCDWNVTESTDLKIFRSLNESISENRNVQFLEKVEAAESVRIKTKIGEIVCGNLE